VYFNEAGHCASVTHSALSPALCRTSAVSLEA
jgi:hypothetical protein